MDKIKIIFVIVAVVVFVAILLLLPQQEAKPGIVDDNPGTNTTSDAPDDNTSEKVCFDGGVLSDFDFENEFMSIHSYRDLATNLTEKYDCIVDTYPHRNIQSIAYLTGDLFFRCSIEGYDSEILNQLYERKRKGDYVTDDSHGPVMALSTLVSEEGATINNKSELADLFIPIDSPKEAIIYASFFSKAGIYEDTMGESGAEGLSIVPCAEEVSGGYIVTAPQTGHTGGCQPQKLEEMTLKVTTEGRIEVISTRTLFTSAYELCAD